MTAEHPLTLAMRRCALQAMYQMDAAQSADEALIGTLSEEDGGAREADVERGMRLASEAWESRHEGIRHC
jgi:transcription termination factor NusB